MPLQNAVLKDDKQVKNLMLNSIFKLLLPVLLLVSDGLYLFSPVTSEKCPLHLSLV